MHATSVDMQITSVDVQVTSLDVQVTSLDVQATSLDMQVTSVDMQVTSVDMQATSVDMQVTSVDMHVMIFPAAVFGLAAGRPDCSPRWLAHTLDVPATRLNVRQVLPMAAVHAGRVRSRSVK